MTEKKINPFELHPEVESLVQKDSNESSTKKRVFEILDSEIRQFMRNDNILMASVLSKIKMKIEASEKRAHR